MLDSSLSPLPESLPLVELTLPDGSVRSVPAGTTGFEVAESIAKSLAKAAVAIRLNGELADLSLPLVQDAKFEIIKREDPAALELIRHDCAHIMAEAVQKLFPGTQVTIGPVIENGFYYDFYREAPFTTEDLTAIESEMRRIVERGDPFIREVWPRQKAIEFFPSVPKFIIS